jgi:hypothetical protein
MAYISLKMFNSKLQVKSSDLSINGLKGDVYLKSRNAQLIPHRHYTVQKYKNATCRKGDSVDHNVIVLSSISQL